MPKTRKSKKYKETASILRAKDEIRFALGLYGYEVTEFDEVDLGRIRRFRGLAIQRRELRFTVLTRSGERFSATVNMVKPEGETWSAEQVSFAGDGMTVVVDFYHGFRDLHTPLHAEVRRLMSKAILVLLDGSAASTDLKTVLADSIRQWLDFSSIKMRLSTTDGQGQRSHRVEIPLLLEARANDGVVYLHFDRFNLDPQEIQVQWGSRFFRFRQNFPSQEWCLAGELRV